MSRKILLIFCFCAYSCGFQFQYKIGQTNASTKSNVAAEHGSSSSTSQQVTNLRQQNCLTNKFPWSQYQRDAQHTGLSSYRGPKKGKFLFVRDFTEATSSLAGAFLSMDTSGNLYFADGDILFVFDGETRKIKQRTIPVKTSSSEWLMPIFDFEQNLYIASAGNRVWNTRDGIKWTPSREFADYVDNMTLPVVDCDNNVYVVIKLVSQFQVCSVKATEIKWCTALPGGGFGKSMGSYAAPAIGRNGEIYVASSNYLTALDANGRIIWKMPAGDYDSIEAAPIVGLNGDIYVGIHSSSNATSTYFYCLSFDGKVRWYYKIAEAGAIRSVAAISHDDKTIYFIADDNYLYAVNSDDGKLKWRYYPVYSDPRDSLVIDNAGTIYVADNRQIVAISQAGKKIWQFSKGWSSGAAFSNPIIAPNGTLYVLYHRTIYAFKD